MGCLIFFLLIFYMGIMASSRFFSVVYSLMREVIRRGLFFVGNLCACRINLTLCTHLKHEGFVYFLCLEHLAEYLWGGEALNILNHFILAFFYHLLKFLNIFCFCLNNLSQCDYFSYFLLKLCFNLWVFIWIALLINFFQT